MPLKIKVKDLKSIYAPVPLKPTYNAEDLYRTIEMPGKSASLVTLLEAAAEWHCSIGSKLDVKWKNTEYLFKVITQITEREQMQLFDSIKPPNIKHVWKEFASQQAHQDFRLNSAFHLCKKFIGSQRKSGKPLEALRFGYEQDMVRDRFTIPERHATAIFARLARFEMQERLLPGKFPARIRIYEKFLSASSYPSKHIHESIWTHAIQLYFRIRIEQHFRTNVLISRSYDRHPKFSRYLSPMRFTLGTVVEWQHAWEHLCGPVCPRSRYQAVWVTDEEGERVLELHIIKGSFAR